MVGTRAYAGFINSLGGINGRKLVIEASDDPGRGSILEARHQTTAYNAQCLVGTSYAASKRPTNC